jgi:lysophospholipase L1-like esterase
MFVARLAVLCLAGGVCAAGCSQTPTGPSPVSAPTVVGHAPQTSAPVPPRLSFNPVSALGVTRYMAFGDSITWGATSAFDPRFLFAAANGGYVERLQAGLNAWHAPQGFTVFNEGQPGEWASDPATLTRFRAALTARQPRAVLLLEGINDLNNDESISRTIGGLRQLVMAATSAGVPVLVATMYQTYVVTYGGETRLNAAPRVLDYNIAIKQMVNSIGVPNVYVVDLYPRMQDRAFIGADGLHLTDQGFEAMATTFLGAIESAFPVRGSFQ